MPAGPVRTNECAGQLDARIRETDVLMRLGVDTSRDALRATFALPRECGEPVAAVPAKLDPRLHRRLHRRARSCSEPVTLTRIEHAHLSRFVECDEVIPAGEFVPGLKVQIRAGRPLVDTAVVAQRRDVQGWCRRLQAPSRNQRKQRKGERATGDQEPRAHDIQCTQAIGHLARVVPACEPVLRLR